MFVQGVIRDNEMRNYGIRDSKKEDRIRKLKSKIRDLKKRFKECKDDEKEKKIRLFERIEKKKEKVKKLRKDLKSGKKHDEERRAFPHSFHGMRMQRGRRPHLRRRGFGRGFGRRGRRMMFMNMNQVTPHDDDVCELFDSPLNKKMKMKMRRERKMKKKIMKSGEQTFMMMPRRKCLFCSECPHEDERRRRRRGRGIEKNPVVFFMH